MPFFSFQRKASAFSKMNLYSDQRIKQASIKGVIKQFDFHQKLAFLAYQLHLEGGGN